PVEPPFETIDTHVADLEQNLSPSSKPCVDDVLDDLGLGVDGDRAASGQLVEVDAMPAAVEAPLDAVVHQPFARQPFAQAGGVEQVDGALLQHPRADPFLRAAPALGLDDNTLDALEMQQVRQQQPRGSCSDDPDLRPNPLGGAPSQPGLRPAQTLT